MNTKVYILIVLAAFLISVYGIIDNYINHHSIIWKVLSAVLSLLLLYLLLVKHKEK
jgi:hypothetical protein